MARRAILRASDADRESVAERLRQATAEGRLLASELEHRLGAALSARTYGELDELVADLPRDAAARRAQPQQSLARLRSIPPLALILLAPVLLALAIVVVVIVASLAIVWAIALALGWWLLGGHRRGRYAARYGRYGARYVRAAHGCRRMHDSRAGAGPGSWI
jgi:hypothetical protein